MAQREEELEKKEADLRNKEANWTAEGNRQRNQLEIEKANAKKECEKILADARAQVLNERDTFEAEKNIELDNIKDKRDHADIMAQRKENELSQREQQLNQLGDQLNTRRIDLENWEHSLIAKQNSQTEQQERLHEGWNDLFLRRNNIERDEMFSAHTRPRQHASCSNLAQASTPAAISKITNVSGSMLNSYVEISDDVKSTDSISVIDPSDSRYETAQTQLPSQLATNNIESRSDDINSSHDLEMDQDSSGTK